MATVALQDMVIFPATAERKGVINVFTDVDCGYCRKLHLEVPELNEMGIEVPTPIQRLERSVLMVSGEV